MINGKILSGQFLAEHAHADGNHKAVLLSASLAGDGAVWPCGLILARDAADKYRPYGAENIAIGAGDGAEKSFNATLGALEPESVHLGDGVETFVDDGFGGLSGDAGGSGSVNYATGKILLTFAAAPTADTAINGTVTFIARAVLDQSTDTATDQTALVVVHGPLKLAALKVGLADQTAPDHDLLQHLQSQSGLYAF